MEAWITRNGSQYRGPFHALGVTLPAQPRPQSRYAWKDQHRALCGAHLERRVLAGEPTGVIVVEQGRPVVRLMRPMAEWDPADRRACPRCRKVLRDRERAQELKEARKYAAEADGLDEGPPPWWHE